MSKCSLCLLVAALVELSLAQPQKNQAPFSITITSPKNAFRTGSEVTVRLVFKNTSDHDVPYERSLGTGVEPRGEFFNDVEVHNAKDDLVPETTYHRALRGKPDTSTKPAVREKTGAAPVAARPPEPRPAISMSSTAPMLKPGESREEDIVVSKLYDLSQPGQYSISVSRRLSNLATDPNSKVVAKSNTLVITITE